MRGCSLVVLLTRSAGLVTKMSPFLQWTWSLEQQSEGQEQVVADGTCCPPGTWCRSAGSRDSPPAKRGKSSVFARIQDWHLVDNGAAVGLLSGYKYGSCRLVGHQVGDVNNTVGVPE